MVFLRSLSIVLLFWGLAFGVSGGAVYAAAKSKHVQLSPSLADSLTLVDTSKEVDEPYVEYSPDFLSLANDSDILTDAYIQSVYPDPIIEVGFRNQLPVCTVNPFSKSNVRFSTGNQHFLILNLYWKWLTLGYSYAMADYTNGYDFIFSPQISNCVVNFEISNIRNYYLRNRSNLMDFANVLGDDQAGRDSLDNLPLPGLETFFWHVNVEMGLNSDYFSTSSSFSTSYSNGQRINAGSLVLGVNVGQDRFKLNATDDRSLSSQSILENLPVRDNNNYNLSLGCGYGYNWVANQGDLVVGFLFVPYLAGAYSNYLIDDSRVYRFAYGARLHSRLNLVYQYKYGFVSLSGDYHSMFFYDNYFSYKRDIFAVCLSTAIKLGDFGIHSNRIPGHQFIDFFDKLF